MKIKDSGFTLIELVVVMAIIAVLATVAIPMAQASFKREKEIELRRNLRSLRTAIDAYKKFVSENNIEVDEDTYGYPKKLDDLVTGIQYRDKNNKARIQKFLRAIPVDPMTSSMEWGLRSYQDDRDDSRWGGENVWDVYTQSEQKALDETAYKDW